MSDYQIRKEAAIDANRCVYPGCELEPAEDSLLCVGHRDAHRARQRVHLKAKRAKWARLRKCLDCGGARKIGRKRCPACLIKRDRLRSAGVDKVVDKSRRIAQATDAITEGDGRTRNRYRGQEKRGRQSNGQLDDQDLGDARKLIERAISGLAHARSDEVKLMPRAQRVDAERAALSLADQASRFIADVLDRHRYRQTVDIGAGGRKLRR